MDAVAVIEQDVRELVRRRGLDPAADPAGIRRLVDEVIADYDERTLISGLPVLADRRAASRRVYDAVAGFGPLQAYLDDPAIEEIWINNRLTDGSGRRSVLYCAVRRMVGVGVPLAEARDVDAASDDLDVMRGDGLECLVVNADAGTRHRAQWSPVVLPMEQRVAV